MIDVKVDVEEAYVPTAAEGKTSLKNAREVDVIDKEPIFFHW